jgi:hypothetical protein
MSSDQFTMDDVYLAKERWQKLLIKDEMFQITQFSQKNRLELAYESAEHNAWIVRTLRDKKQRYRFPKCNNLIMIGSGIYPYSMFDVHKQYPHIKQVGLEIDEKRAKISRKLVASSPAKNDIKIITCDAYDFDYSWLGIDDLVFISVDVEHKRIFSKIIETSKAQLHICAPYDKTWLYNLLKAKGAI